MRACYQRDGFLYMMAVSVSLLLSFLTVYRESVINPDAICYLLSAETLSTSGLSAAMHLCGQAKWPFYSGLIALVARSSHLSFLVSAYVIDAFFSAISVLTFIFIVKLLGGSRRVLWLALAVILLSHEFNSVRQYIVRDHGFWAFYLVSVYCLLRYFLQPKLLFALAFGVSLLIATAFRIEGAIFLLALPMVAFFYPRYLLSQRVTYFFTLNTVTLVVVGVMVVWLLIHPQQTLDQWGRIIELKNQLFHGVDFMVNRYHTAKAGLAQYVLTPDSRHDAGLLLLVVLMVSYVLMVISNVSFIYSVLILYAWCRRLLAQQPTWVIAAYLCVNVVITLGFLAEHFFLSKRYLLGLSLILMLFVPFALDDLIKRAASLSSRLLLLGIAFLMLVSGVGGIGNFGYSKAYLKEAGEWLSQHVPNNAELYANDLQVMYYSHHFGEGIFVKRALYTQQDSIAHGRWKQYDYLALRLNQQKPSVLQELNLKPVQIFSNKRGDRVEIYQVHPLSIERR